MSPSSLVPQSPGHLPPPPPQLSADNCAWPLEDTFLIYGIPISDSDTKQFFTLMRELHPHLRRYNDDNIIEHLMVHVCKATEWKWLQIIGVQEADYKPHTEEDLGRVTKWVMSLSDSIWDPSTVNLTYEKLKEIAKICHLDASQVTWFKHLQRKSKVLKAYPSNLLPPNIDIKSLMASCLPFSTLPGEATKRIFKARWDFETQLKEDVENGVITVEESDDLWEEARKSGIWLR